MAGGPGEIMGGGSEMVVSGRGGEMVGGRGSEMMLGGRGGDTGELVEKTEPGRRVTSFYEGTNVSSILPLMTQPFDFR